MSRLKDKQTRNKYQAKDDKSAYSPIMLDLQGLIQLRYQSTHLSLGSQRKAYSSLSGNYTSSFKGRGLNFDEVRPYQPGDDIRNIDWNVTARTGMTHTKVFKEERERPVFIIVDLRKTLFFGTRHCLKSVTAAKAAALFAWAGADNSNRIGGLIFDDNCHVEMRPKGGHQGVVQFLKLLHDFHNQSIEVLQKKQAKSNEPPIEEMDVNLLFARMKKTIHPGSIVLFASDLHHFDTDFTLHIQYLSRHNDVIMAHIYDTFERQLPPSGLYGISNGTQSQTLDANDSTLQQSFAESFVQKNELIEQFCLSNRIHLIHLATDDSVAEQFLAALGKDSSVRRVARSRH